MDSIEWQSWEPKTFTLAQAQKKPILLVVSASWCHWCHEFDGETLSAHSVVSFVNSNLVPIRVDADQRPDINIRYNSGAWPSVTLLDSNGIPLQSGTFFHEDEFLEWLQRGLMAFKTLNGISPLKGIFTHVAPRDFSGVSLEKEMLSGIETHALNVLKQEFDSEYYGFGLMQKFPQLEALSFLVFELREKKDSNLEQVLFPTLTVMSTRGLWDHEEKGFFRYCTSRRWLEPHTEKMLEDNCRLALIFLDSYALSGNEQYRKLFFETLEYLESHLQDPKTGFFFGSQNADERYYSLSLDERKRVSPPSVDQTVFTAWNAMMAVLYLKAFNTLQQDSFAGQSKKLLDYLVQDALQENGKVEHQAGQKSGVSIFRDHAWLLKALVDAYQTTLEPDYLEKAEKIAVFCEAHFRDLKTKSFSDSLPGEDAFGLLLQPRHDISDNVLMAECLLKLAFWNRNPGHGLAAMDAFKSFLGVYEELGLLGVAFGKAAVLFRDGLNETRLVGKENPETDSWKKAFLSKYFEKNALQFVPSGTAEGKQLVGEHLHHLPLAFICRRGICLPPTGDYNLFVRTI